MQEAAAARWVRRLDPVSSRAFGVGKRKTSVAHVWLKEGAGEPPAAVVSHAAACRCCLLLPGDFCRCLLLLLHCSPRPQPLSPICKCPFQAT